MAEEDQAQADLQTETVVDPLDATNSQNSGTTDLSAYEDEIEAMKQGGEIQLGDDEQEQSADDEADPLEESADDLDEQSSEEEETEEEEPEVKTSKRIRLSDPEEIAIHAIKRAKGCTLVEATRYYLGEQPAKAAEATQEQAPEKSENLAGIEAEIDDLYEQKDAAIRAIDVDTQAELEKQIRQLEKKARLLAVTEAEQSARNATAQLEQAQQDFDNAWEFSRARYPELNDPNSAMYKEVARLDAEMQELGDPLANDPKRLWDLAKRAGLNTRTPMTKPRESSAPSKGKTGSPVKPAAGNRGTTSADSNQKFEQKVEGLQSLDEYEESVRLMLGKA